MPLPKLSCHTQVPGQIGQIEQLCTAGGQCPQKALELGKIAYLPEGPHIPLKVCT